MPTIKNQNYRNFLDKGIIQTLTLKDIQNAISNIKTNKEEAKSLITILYYTGARPNEVLLIKAKDITKENQYIIIQLQGSKNGLPRKVYLQYKYKLIKELYQYSNKLFEDAYIFYHFKGNHKRTYINKKGEIKNYTETSYKLRYYFNKWFKDLPESISPYFLRHNRFSILAEKDLSVHEIRILKGARTLQSVMPYIHMSSKTGKKIARKID